MTTKQLIRVKLIAVGAIMVTLCLVAVLAIVAGQPLAGTLCAATAFTMSKTC